MPKQLSTCIFIFFCCTVLNAQSLYKMPAGVQSAVSSPENINGIKGNAGKSNAGAKGNAFFPLKAGERKTLLDVKTAGIIQRMWFTISDRSPEMLRALRLQIFWDGEAVAAVDVPFGDFFCANVGKPTAFQSALFSNPEGRSFNCYIPMPFAKGAKLVLANESNKELPLLFFDIDFVKKQVAEKDQLYFHAVWNRSRDTTVGKDAEILPRITGRGRFLGVSGGVNTNPVYGNSWWGEGEVKMYIDGDSKYPTINGTGTEDYIGTGWGQGVFAHNYQGCLVADEKNRQYTFYRWHIPDEIWFYHDCRVTLQQIGGWPVKDVKALQASGVRLIPVSVFKESRGFRGLFEKNVPANELENADNDEWLNFYRADDFAITAYFYLDRPGGTAKK